MVPTFVIPDGKPGLTRLEIRDLRGALSGPAGACGTWSRQSWVPDLRPDRYASGLSSGMTNEKCTLSLRHTPRPLKLASPSPHMHRKNNMFHAL